MPVTQPMRSHFHPDPIESPAGTDLVQILYFLVIVLRLFTLRSSLSMRPDLPLTLQQLLLSSRPSLVLTFLKRQFAKLASKFRILMSTLTMIHLMRQTSFRVTM